MDGAATEAIASAVRTTTGSLVVAGDAEHRSAAADVLEPDTPLVEVRPAALPGPWSGLAAVLVACRDATPDLQVPAALEAAATGRAVGDHLGLGADLCGLLASMGEERPWTLLVHDAHRLDLSSAAVLSHALAGAPTGVRALVTQDRSDRGVEGLPLHVAGGGTGDHVAPVLLEPADIDDARRQAREAARVGAVLDAAQCAEAVADWVPAARWWLDGGRPRRCRRALAIAAPGPEVDEVAARLALRTASERRRRAAVERALASLDGHDPVAAIRLRLLEASARRGRDDAGCGSLLAGAGDALADLGSTPAERVVRELHALVARTDELARCGDPSALLPELERPLARLGTGGVDPDAVHLLTAAARTLGWHGHLDEARALLDRVIGVLDARRHLVLLGQPLATSAWLARRRGRFELALTHGTRAMELAGACGWTREERLATVEVAHVEAVHGRLEDCRRHVATLVPPGTEPRGAAQVGAVSALAVAELLADDPARAVELLEPVQRGFGVSVSPAETAWRHNLVEAYVRTGRHDDAEAVLRDLVRWAERTGTAREQGLVAWCRGMLAPAGEHGEHFADARRRLAAYPTVRWRAELHHLRRLLDEGRRDEADRIADELVVEAAGEGLTALAERVRHLQRQHGIDAPDPAPSTSVLSVEDLRVALALAEGAEVDEVAASLRLTTKHVALVRQRVLDLLGVATPEQIDGLLGPAPRPSGAAAHVRVLGPTVVQRGSQHLVPPTGRPAAVLALVAVDGAVPVERVLDVLWPDADPARSRPRLRNVLARLRAAVGPVIGRDRDRLVLAPDVEVDAHRFDRLAEAALRAPADEVLARTGQALAAWHGEPLPNWPYEDWALRERHRLVARCVAVHVRRSEALAAAGAVSAALDSLEDAVALHPDDSDLWSRAVALAEADGRVGRARILRRRAADHDVVLD